MLLPGKNGAKHLSVRVEIFQGSMKKNKQTKNKNKKTNKQTNKKTIKGRTIDHWRERDNTFVLR